MQNKLGNWKWQEIHAMYKVYGEQLREYADTAERFEIAIPMDKELREFATTPGALIPTRDLQHADFVNRWFRDVKRIVGQLKALDREIARRNKLIGVMG